MKALLELFEKGGPVMYAIIALSVVLYTRCFHLLLWLRRESRRIHAQPVATSAQLAAQHRRQLQVQETFRQQRIALAAMIAAAPLLGLLGTVSGLVRTFETLADHVGQKSMEGLAQGISEVLVATESGLAVALPALLFVYLAHRAVQRNRQRLNRLETARGEGATS
jgi:biopolymer transport protein ExbB/TolQ